MAEFYFPPEWLAAAGPPPDVDPDRIEGLQNGFLAATHEALHTAPDAFYGKAGQDAVEGVPALQERLSQLRDAALEGAKDDGERAALTPRLDAQLTNVQGGIDRHVAEQKEVRNRQIALERHALIERSAAAEPDEMMLPSLAQANASVAQSIARMTGAPEEPAILAARSAVWRSAIGQRLATGQGARAIALFDLMKDRLVPADQRALDVPIQAARTDAAADQWIEREAATQGEPLATRLQADTSLSPAEKATALAKVEAKNSAQESARLTTVKGLDDRLGAASQALATQPTVYRPGTLATIADGYDAAGELDKANAARRVALQESFLLPFARSSVAAQQRLIDSLPEGEDRSAAEMIQRQQAEAFAKDAFSAGTALYPEVGPPVPIDDLAGRVAQARTITAYRGIPVAPFTADEIAAMRRQLADGTPQQRDAVLTHINALPGDMKAAADPTFALKNAEPGTLRRALDELVSQYESGDIHRTNAGSGPQDGLSSDGPSKAKPDEAVQRAQADDLVTPRGFTYERAPPELDPRKLNRPLPRAEQQQIANILGKILSGRVAELGLHRYDNYPHPATGAVLPPSKLGYLAVDVPNSDPDRGETRLVIDRSTGTIFYSNTHYRSFFPIRLNPKPN